MYIIIYDFGTSSVKTCLFEIDSEIRILASSTAEYGLYISDDGGAEQDTIRFVGGGALSPFTCQMLADITGRTIETVNNTQEVGAIGTALVVAAGLKGVDVLELGSYFCYE